MDWHMLEFSKGSVRAYRKVLHLQYDVAVLTGVCMFTQRPNPEVFRLGPKSALVLTDLLDCPWSRQKNIWQNIVVNNHYIGSNDEEKKMPAVRIELTTFGYPLMMSNHKSI